MRKVCGLVLTALILLLSSSELCEASGVYHGLIRWDAWYTNNIADPGFWTANTLSPSQYQFRAPSHSKIAGSSITWVPTQGTFDQEIQAAHNGGVAYWSYLLYGGNGQPNHAPYGQFDPTNAMNKGLAYHMSSSIKSQMPFTIMPASSLMGTYVSYSTSIAALDALTRDSAYFHVPISGVSRPLLFIYYSASDISGYWNGSLSNFAAAIAALRTSISSHDNNPYIVLMGGSNSTAISLGVDALSTYLCCGASAANQTWTAFEALVEGYWSQQVSASGGGVAVVPNFALGAAAGPRLGLPVPWQNTGSIPGERLLATAALPTNQQLVTMFSNLNTFVAANSASVPCMCTIGYAWDECDENFGCLIPTIGDPFNPITGTTSKLGAISSTIAH